MTPLRITAKLQDAIVLTTGTLALDGLLASMYAMVNRLPPIAEPFAVFPLPLKREPKRRFDLASFAVPMMDQYETTHEHKAFPVRAARAWSTVKRVDQKAGINKSHRMPLALSHSATDALVWWCIGEQNGIENLLQYCHHLGKKRAHGMGRVLSWDVSPCETWDGFPVVLSGRPLRNLPTDWPGLDDPDTRTTRLTYPYWPKASGQQLCAVPDIPEAEAE